MKNFFKLLIFSLTLKTAYAQSVLSYPPTSICCQDTTPIVITPTKSNLADTSVIFKFDSSTPPPAFLSINSATGTITNSPPSLLTARERKPLIINAFKNNEIIAASALSLEIVLLALPNITYAKTDWTFTRNSPLTENPTPTNTGGAIAEWSISPELPTGLIFKEGIISGTPSAVLAKTSFTVTAKNRAGSSTAVLSITVNDIAPVISYAKDNWIFVKNTPISDKPTPTNTGGKPDSWSITPDLPAGLIFSEGIISGTPTTTSKLTTYTVTAKNITGSSSATLSITVKDIAPIITFAKTDWIFKRNSPLTENPTATNSGGAIESWSISPALPAGLTFKDGVISGTPTVALAKTPFTISAKNGAELSTSTISITVTDIAPTPIANNTSPLPTEDTQDYVPGGNGVKITPNPLVAKNTGFAHSADISGDGKTAIFSTYRPFTSDQVWVYIKKEDGTWSEQAKFSEPNDYVHFPNKYKTSNVAISRDGNTAIVGRTFDSNALGAAWIYVRNEDGVWSQQGPKLVGSNYKGLAPTHRDYATSGLAVYQGSAVDISADGNTVIIGGYGDSDPNVNPNDRAGAAWVFTRSEDGTWTEQVKLTTGIYDRITNNLPSKLLGTIVQISADGNRAVVVEGGSTSSQRFWIFDRNEEGWKRSTNGLYYSGTNAGRSVALSGDGQTIAYQSSARTKGAFVFYKKNSQGIWQTNGAVQTAPKPKTSDDKCINSIKGAMNYDGTSMIVACGSANNYPYSFHFKVSGSKWIKTMTLLKGNTGNIYQTPGGISDDGKTVIFNGLGDNEYRGAAWIVEY